MGKRVLLTGATGEIGSALSALLIGQGYDLVVLSRDPNAARAKIPGAATYLHWGIGQRGEWEKQIDGAYAVIHCAGINIFGQRYTRAFAKQANDSRVLGARTLVEAIERASEKPKVFINSSSQGYYGFSKVTDSDFDEDSPAGEDRWGQESIAIDQEPYKVAALGVRVVSMRTGYVLDAQGGGLPRQVEQIRKGQGGAVSPVNAWNAWIHITDEVNLYRFALEDERVRGPLNCTAPHPVTNQVFANTLSLQVTGQPNHRTIPAFMLRLFVGPVADIYSRGKRIIPRKALALGFQFAFPTIESALADLVPQISAQPYS